MPYAIIPAALTMLYLRSAILYPRYLYKLEFTPVKSRYYKTKYLLEAGRDSMLFATDMVCLALFVYGFFAVGWNLWPNGTEGLQFIEKFYTLWAVPFFGTLFYFLTKQKR